MSGSHEPNRPHAAAKRRALDAIDGLSDRGYWPPTDVHTGRDAPRDAAVADASVPEPSDASPDAIEGTRRGATVLGSTIHSRTLLHERRST